MYGWFSYSPAAKEIPESELHSVIFCTECCCHYLDSCSTHPKEESQAKKETK
jgi:hypothetical protein